MRFPIPILTAVLLFAGALSAATPQIIFDTDMSGDCDDAGALAVLHALADRGECEILACMTSDRNAASGACVDAINTFYGRGDIPIGLLAETDTGEGHSYPRTVAAEFPHDFVNAEAPEAVDLYRQILAAAEDRSVTIVTVGFLPNVGRLLATGPDEHSPLTGEELVRAKVDVLVAMAGGFPTGREYNMRAYAREDAARVVERWSAPIVYSGFEIGRQIDTGPRLWTETGPENPVRRSYEIYLNWSADSQRSRYSWDQTAVLYAVRGAGARWDLETVGSNTFDVSDGSNAWVSSPDPSGRDEQAYLLAKAPHSVIEDEIEDLMVAAPQLGAPVARIALSTDGLSIHADGSGSAGSELASWRWDFGDGSTAEGVAVNHTYTEAGIYSLRLTVTNAAGSSDQATTTVSVGDGSPNNQPDPQLNLALLASAELAGSVTGGRGSPLAICFDPATGDYATTTAWNEYGVAYGADLGRPGPEDGLRWQVAWPHPKRIDYVTFGGAYPNQPQPHTAWRISYRSGGSWSVLEEGVGGWIDSGIFEWGGAGTTPIVADALRVDCFSDGAHDLVSIHLRGRGGRSANIDDRATEPKACLIQYLGGGTAPPPPPPSTDGLVAHWTCDEGDGSHVGDSAGEHHGTLLAASGAWIDGVQGGALGFGPAGRHVDVPADPALGLRDLTIAGWFRFDQVDGGWSALVEHDRQGAGWYGLFKRHGARRLHFRWGPNFGAQTLDSGTDLEPGRWYHVAATYDAATGEARIHLDGELDASGSGPAPEATTAALRIGANLAGGEIFPGAVDDLRIYARALDAAAVRALAGVGSNRPPTLEPGTITLRGRAIDPDGDAVEVFVDGEPAELVDGEWRIEVPAHEGERIYSVIAVDAAGATSSRSITVIREPGPEVVGN